MDFILFMASTYKESGSQGKQEAKLLQQRIGWNLSRNQIKTFAGWKDKGKFLGPAVQGMESYRAKDPLWASDL